MTEAIAERIRDPIHRVSYSFRRDGGNLWVLTWLEDGGHLPEHFHPSLEEHWEVLEGTVKVKLDGAWRDLVPDDGPIPGRPRDQARAEERERPPGAPAHRGDPGRPARGVPHRERARGPLQPAQQADERAWRGLDRGPREPLQGRDRHVLPAAGGPAGRRAARGALCPHA